MAAKVDHFPFADAVSHLKYLSAELQKQKHLGDFCDVSLKIMGHTIAVHSCVLAAFCRLEFGNSEAVSNVKHTIELDVGVDDCTEPAKEDTMYPDALNKIVDFMYTGKLDVTATTAIAVKRLAEKIELKQIVDYCDNLLCACDAESTRMPKRKKHLRVKKKVVKKSRICNVKSPKATEPALVHIDVCVNEEPREHERSTEHMDEKVNKCLDDASNAGPTEDTGTGCQDTVTSTDDMAADETAKSKPFVCDRCPYVGRTALQMVKHDRIHAGGKWYACCSCGFLALKVNRLLNHLREMRHNETVCSLCSLETGSSAELLEHLRLHEHAKPFFCWSCDRRFSTRTALNLHLPKHSNQKPFVCSLCGRGFKWKHALQSHMLVHSQEKQHLCDQCGYRTAHQSSFKAHCLLHAGATFKCPQSGCSFQAVRKQNLQQHLKTHLKEKPFQCEVCGRAFSLVKNLRRHARMHNAAESQLRCVECGFTTTRIDKMKEHTRKHHAPTSTWDPSLTRVLSAPPSPHNSSNDIDDDDVEVVPVVTERGSCTVANLSALFPNLHMVLDGGKLAPVSDTLTLIASSTDVENATSSVPITFRSVQNVGGQHIVTYSTVPVTQALPVVSFQAKMEPSDNDA